MGVAVHNVLHFTLPVQPRLLLAFTPVTVAALELTAASTLALGRIARSDLYGIFKLHATLA
jgi:hypothetical protein